MVVTYRLATILQNVRSRALYRFFPRFVDWLVAASTYLARKKISEVNACRVLVDNCVIGHAVTHETGWVDTGRKLWGDSVQIDTGYAARIPVYSDTDESNIARSVRYLVPIASMARQGLLKLLESPELVDERLSQPIGRFSGYGLYDFSLFKDVKFEYISDPTYTMSIGPRWSHSRGLEEQRKARLSRMTDPLYQGLLEVLGPKNSQDAYHIATAEKHGCYCFLTMDFSLIRAIRAHSGHPVILSLKTLVVTPEEFGHRFALQPFSTRLFSFHGASYPVLHDTNWPDSKRQKQRSNN